VLPAARFARDGVTGHLLYEPIGGYFWFPKRPLLWPDVVFQRYTQNVVACVRKCDSRAMIAGGGTRAAFSGRRLV